MRHLTLILLTVFSVACSRGGAERLPDLPEPLSTPYAMVLNGELTLFGGHTDGFVLSQSAWYLRGGSWHKVPMKYPHDHGFCTLLPDGRVLVSGNWYAPDAMEIYEPGKGFSFLKDVTVQCNIPYILASAVAMS